MMVKSSHFENESGFNVWKMLTVIEWILGIRQDRPHLLSIILAANQTAYPIF